MPKISLWQVISSHQPKNKDFTWTSWARMRPMLALSTRRFQAMLLFKRTMLSALTSKFWTSQPSVLQISSPHSTASPQKVAKNAVIQAELWESIVKSPSKVLSQKKWLARILLKSMPALSLDTYTSLSCAWSKTLHKSCSSANRALVLPESPRHQLLIPSNRPHRLKHSHLEVIRRFLRLRDWLLRSKIWTQEVN